mgnify:CR=1 FL=1
MNSHKTKNFFRVSAEDFKKIPGSPIAYWMNDSIKRIYGNNPLLGDIAEVKIGMGTGKNEIFVRRWWEISYACIDFSLTNIGDLPKSNRRYFPYNKGGDFRRWYGNLLEVLWFDSAGRNLMNTLSGHRENGAQNRYCMKGLTWSFISSSNFGIRYLPSGCFFDVAGSTLFTKDCDTYILGFLASNVCYAILKMLNPTVNFQAGNLKNLPLIYKSKESVDRISITSIHLSRHDWNSYETSWDFQMNPLVVSPQEWEDQLSYGMYSKERKNAISLLSERYERLRNEWKHQTEEMRRLEIENNRIFIEAYGLQDELSPEVPWNEITLTCNPWYRYGKTPTWENTGALVEENGELKIQRIPTNEDMKLFPYDENLECRLREDTIKEYISYAVGCMMGRYSPEKPGLILANQPISGQDDEIEYQTAITGSNIFGALGATRYFTIKDDKRKITSYSDFYDVFGDEGNYHQFMDRDGVLPILDEEWFLDDIVAQFKAFLQFTFGAEHFADNLDFIEKALGKDIRKYFIKDFYKDHVQRYKKRPIYWMFSSPKGSFNALIYMHRYRPDTVSIVLNEYLREFISKIRSHREHLITENNRATLAPAEKTRNLKLIDKYAAMLTELDAYERDILYPLAQQKIAIDLDDGVKVNYCKFGAALKKIPGLEAKEE